MSAFILGAVLVLSGCGSSSDNSSDSAKTDPLELESDGKTLIFYSALANSQYGFEVDSQKIINLQQSTDDDGNDISNFNIATSNRGKLFIWIDDKGDSNLSNDESKVLMFKQDYSFKDDGNASWEDFYYLGHFHGETENSKTTYHLAAHSNAEFNVTSGAKYDAIVRINRYLATQNTLENNLSNILPTEANGLCGFYTSIKEEGESLYYAMGKNGTLYIYDKDMSKLDSVTITDICEENKFGISSTEDGVLLFSEHTQKVYAVDSHDDGIYHMHTSWDVSRFIGSGNMAEMMVGLEPLTE